MIDFYTFATSNGQRVAVMLEECGLPYTVHRVDLTQGEQAAPAFLAVNPAGAIPAIVDHDGPDRARLTLAQSGAILIYLAEKCGRFLPASGVARAQAWQWALQATTDTAASSAGVFVLSRIAPERSPANVAFFEERTVRHLRDADRRLADRPFLAGELSIADFALYPLVALRRPLIDQAGNLPHLTRWAATLAARPAVERGMCVAA